ARIVRRVCEGAWRRAGSSVTRRRTPGPGGLGRRAARAVGIAGCRRRRGAGAQRAWRVSAVLRENSRRAPPRRAVTRRSARCHRRVGNNRDCATLQFRTMTYIAAQHRYDDAPFRTAGRSGLKLPPISLGLWHNFGNDTPLERQRAILRTAFDLGVTHF